MRTVLSSVETCEQGGRVLLYRVLTELCGTTCLCIYSQRLSTTAARRHLDRCGQVINAATDEKQTQVLGPDCNREPHQPAQSMPIWCYIHQAQTPFTISSMQGLTCMFFRAVSQAAALSQAALTYIVHQSLRSGLCSAEV